MTRAVVEQAAMLRRVSVSFHEPVDGRSSLLQVSDDLAYLPALFFVGFWCNPDLPSWYSEAPERDGYAAKFFVAEMSKNSPLSVVLEITAGLASILGSARGVIYLLERWQDLRIKAGRANYEVAAYTLVSERLAAMRMGLLERGDVLPVLEFLPNDAEVQTAATMLDRVNEVTVEEE